MKEVNIDVLREHYPDEYDKAFTKWAVSVQEIIGEDWPEYSQSQAERELDGSGWCVISAGYNVYSGQADGVVIEAKFKFDAACAEQQDQMRRNYPMCTEMLRLGYIEIDCGALLPSKVISVPHCEVDFGFWATDSEDEVIEEGIYKGLSLATAQNIIAEEDVDAFAKWLHGDVESAEHEVYLALRNDADHQQSEEAFIEWAREFRETFEVKQKEAMA